MCDIENLFEEEKMIHARLRARHVTKSAKFINFYVSSSAFRHKHELHVHCVHAVAQAVGLMLDRYDPISK